jgi:protein-S-isoprenylcysteine O-methyltransferase Ste14
MGFIMMGLFKDWGFTAESWQGKRGEYWVLVQGILILGFAVLPIRHLGPIPQPPVVYGVWAIAAILGFVGITLFTQGLVDLGQNLTPLPHPRQDGKLIQTGVYAWVRHPVYGGVIFVAIAWAFYQWSLWHAIGAIGLFIFLDAKARQEETWLTQKHPDYESYRQQVKKLIPWVY